jgi:hypothetical protein
MILPPIGSGSAESNQGSTRASGPPKLLDLPGTGADPVAVARADDRVGPAVPEPSDGQRPPRILRPARVGGGESVVFVECKNDVVIIHPTRKRVAVESLNHSPPYNPLVLAVRQQAQRRQAQAQPGDVVKVQVRFLVHRDGERTFHLAYPALEVLKLPMTRYSLQNWDDVGRLVTEY